jgi:nucleoid DNA-binding protein
VYHGDYMAAIRKSDIKRRMANRLPEISEKDFDLGVDCILDYIAHQIGRGYRFEIRNFGSFKAKIRTARQVRNPKSGAVLFKPLSVLPAFKCGINLRKRLNSCPENEGSY